MIDNIIQSVTEKLSSLPYIEGIVLGGSRARGTHTEDSDIDIGIYYKSESFDALSSPFQSPLHNTFPVYYCGLYIVFPLGSAFQGL